MTGDEVATAEAPEAEPPIDPTDPEAEAKLLLTINRLGRDLRGLQRSEDEAELLYQDELERLKQWRDDRLAGLHERRETLERALENAARAAHGLDGRKTWATPTVRVSLRKPTPHYEVVDKEALERWLVGWCVEHDRRKPLHVSALVSTLSAEVRTTDSEALGTPEARRFTVVDVDSGEVVPGVQLVQSRSDTFSYKPT